MATLSHSESRRLYSWWWDSHISPKNSKWLQDNLTDMDAKVKAMIKLIEEDADSFARRAEMYYKKRPELMKLVEEFYRAYRALAERYNHATGELRQAHRTIAQAFPNQDSFSVNDDTSQSSESHTPVSPHPNHSFLDPDDLHEDVHWLYSSNLHGLKRGASADESNLVVGRKGLKQLNEMFRAREALSDDPKLADVRKPQSVGQQGEPDRGRNLKEESRNLKSQTLNDPKRTVNTEMDLQTMREALSKMEAERDAVLLQYKQSLKKLADLEKQLSLAQKNARELDQQSSKAVAEIKELKEALANLEAERDANLIRYTESLQMVSTLEMSIVAAQEDARGMSERVVKAETELDCLKQELSRSLAEQEASRLLYEQSLEKISVLEVKMSHVEGNAKLLSDRSDKAENEVKILREELFRSNEMKDDVALQYKECLEKISELQNELRAAQEETRRLNNENLLGAAKLKGAEDQCVLLNRMNQSLLSEAEILSQRIAAKDHELSEKHSELEKLQISLQDEHTRFVQVEATLQALQDLHSRSQEEQSNLALELRNGLQKLKDLEISKHDLETEVDLLKEKNCSLNDLNLATSTSEKNLQDEIASLRQMKEKLENEVRQQEEQNDALRQQAVLLKEEIEDLRHRYQAIIQQVVSTGLEPESLSSSVRHLQDENSRLKQVSCEQRAEREVLLKKLDGMEEKSAFLESCLSDVNADLERSKSKMKLLKQSCQLLSGEKSALAGEKSALLSQLQITIENMQKLLEKNAMLENSLSVANVELEGLREKSKGLEEFCHFLNNEKSSLLAERSNLISRLENVEKKLENMETRCSILEDKYGALEKEKESTLTQVEELRVSLGVEKRERASLVLTNETRLSGLEDRIHHLQAENSYRKKDFEEQLDKAVNAQVEIIILQKFLHDMEDKNYYLLTECQKHMEEIQYSENLISELEGENLMHQVETEFLLDRISKLRAGMWQVLKALEMSHISETEPEQNFLPCILANIRDNRKSLRDSRNENIQLLVENSILTTLLGQLKLEGSELESQMEAVGLDFLLLSQKYAVLETENCKILERSGQLDIEIVERERREEMLNAEMASLLDKQAELQGAYAVLEYEQVNASQENSNMRKEFAELRKEKCISEEENRTLLAEALAMTCQCEVFKNYGLEKASELCAVSEKMEGLRKAYDGLEQKAVALSEKHLMKEIENLYLRKCGEKSEEDKHKLKECNDQLKLQISAGKELLDHKSTQLSEAMQELRRTQDMVTELCRTVKGLENKQEELEITRDNLENQVIELSCKNKSQDKEIRQIREDNAKLESEAGTLHEEIEEHKMREAVLSSELQERSSESELWEAEAASFHFDFQISAVREVLYENKVHELSESLEDVSSRSSTEIERTKQRVHSLEGEAEGLRAQLAAYVPIVISLKENVSSLEKNLDLQLKHQLPDYPERQVVASTAHADYSGVQDTSEESCTEAGVTELQNLQARIKAIESALAEHMENVAIQERANSSKKLEAASKQIEELQSVFTSHQAAHLQKQERKLEAFQYNHRKFPEQTAEISEARNVTQMKDIPLDHVSGGDSLHVSSRKGIRRPDDQMLELWESAEHESDHDLILRKLDKHISSSRRHAAANHLSRFGRRSRTNPVPESEIEKELGVDKLEVSNQDENKKGILERLTGDSEKLMSLQVSVQELRSKMDTGKKKKNTKNFEYDRLRSQLQEAENTLIQLMDTNTELMRMAEDESPITCNENLQIKKVAEQARIGSEKIGKLQLEMQTIQYLLLKMEDEKKGKSRFSTSRTGIMMREFVYRREKDDKKKRKGRFCSCIRSSSSSIDN